MGDLILQALLSMLCGALMVMWLMKVFVIPEGTSVFQIQNSVPYNISDSDTVTK
tara:strand:- start:542 stop:703 length:162 start_codon:yes stop_codon:yes gene_type:complete